jgi:GntR family transcriptional regulator
MGIELRIVTGASQPIYQQIVDQVRVAIANGAAAPGDQLPSVRALAEQLVVNPNTVARAYSDLVRDGLLATQPGRGLYIAPRRQVFSDGERRRRLDEAVGEFVRKVALLDFSRVEIMGEIAAALNLIDQPGAEASPAAPPAKSIAREQGEPVHA